MIVYAALFSVFLLTLILSLVSFSRCYEDELCLKHGIFSETGERALAAFLICFLAFDLTTRA